MGESVGVTASTSRCRKEGGVDGEGDSAMEIYVGSFEYKGEGKGLTGGIGWSRCSGEERRGIIGGRRCEWVWSTSTSNKKQPKDTYEEGTRFSLMERRKLLREVAALQKSRT